MRRDDSWRERKKGDMIDDKCDLQKKYNGHILKSYEKSIIVKMSVVFYIYSSFLLHIRVEMF